MLRLAKVATPATAAAVAVPDNEPPAGFAPMATVTLPVKPVVVVPMRSRAVTCTAGAIATPADVVLGWTVNASWLGAPAPAVAVNDTGDPASPLTLAEAVWAPTVLPSTRVACASPVALVTEVGVIEPPPAVIAQVTVTPLTPLPCASVTR